MKLDEYILSKSQCRISSQAGAGWPGEPAPAWPGGRRRPDLEAGAGLTWRPAPAWPAEPAPAWLHKRRCICKSEDIFMKTKMHLRRSLGPLDSTGWRRQTLILQGVVCGAFCWLGGCRLMCFGDASGVVVLNFCVLLPGPTSRSLLNSKPTKPFV